MRIISWMLKVLCFWFGVRWRMVRSVFVLWVFRGLVLYLEEREGSSYRLLRLRGVLERVFFESIIYRYDCWFVFILRMGIWDIRL